MTKTGLLGLFIRSFPYWTQLYREKGENTARIEVAAQTPLEDPDLETISYRKTGAILVRNTEITAGKLFCLSLLCILQEMPRDSGVRNTANRK